MSRFLVTDTPIAGLKIIERKRVGDTRGFLSRLFCATELSAANWRKPIAQINHTLTQKRGAVRGLHFQHPPYAEMKLVSCIRGEVWDLAVDLRKNSPTFLKWHAVNLSADNGRALLIQEGMCHGFQTLSDNVELLYCHSAPYMSEAEEGLNPLDPRLGIVWPLPIMEMSERDKNHPLLTQAFEGMIL